MVRRFFQRSGAQPMGHVQSVLLEMLANDRHSFDVATSALLDGAGSIYYYPGATGMLSSESNRVQRSLPWGVFRSGRARPWHDGSV